MAKVMTSSFESYWSLFSAKIPCSYGGGKFKHTGVVLLSPDGRGDGVAGECAGCTDIILLILYFCYKLLVSYYFGLELLL
jgi:hypothetical protein